MPNNYSSTAKNPAQRLMQARKIRQENNALANAGPNSTNPRKRAVLAEREGLKMASFLGGIGKSAEKLEEKAILSVHLLERIREEMQVQWEIEKEVTAMLPVHNIGALSLDTINLKNVLRAESRAWKMLFGQMLLSHAGGLLKGLTKNVDSITIILKNSKQSETNVHEMVKLVTAVSDAETFDKIHEEHFSIVMKILDWSEACGIGAQNLRKELEILRNKSLEMIELKDIERVVAEQERDRLIGQLAIDTGKVAADSVLSCPPQSSRMCLLCDSYLSEYINVLIHVADALLSSDLNKRG